MDDTEYSFRKRRKGEPMPLSEDSSEELVQATQEIQGLAVELRKAMKQLKEDSGPKVAARPDTLVHEVQEAVAFLSQQKAAYEQQKDAEDQRKRQRRKWGWIASIIGGVAAPGGGYAYYRMPNPAEETKKEFNARVDTLEKTVKGCTVAEMLAEECTQEMKDVSIQGVGQENSRRTKRLGDLHMDQRELILEVRDEDMKVQRAIADRLRVELPSDEPDKVKAARDEVKAYKKLKEAKEVEEALKKGDPFAGLE